MAHVRLLGFIFLSALSGRAVTVEALAPSPGATNVGTSPGFTVLATGMPDANATLTFYQRLAPSPVRPDFSIVLLGDTQFYCKGYLGGTPQMFSTQTDWVVANRTNLNIVFVGHLGDCVYSASVLSEWQAATDAMYRLEDPFTTLLEHGIPYSMCVGNHDMDNAVNGTASGRARYYNQFFGVSHFEGRPYYGGHWNTNNNNHFTLFSASGIDFIALELEYWPSPPVLAWANQVLQTNLNRRAIIMSHCILNPTNGFTSDGGQQIYDALKANTNVFLMLSGHWPQIGRRADTFAGNTIHTILSDYENETNGGSGWLRTMTFSPSNNVIRVRTFSPVLNEYKTGPFHEFDVPFNGTASASGYSVFASATCTGTTALATASASNLQPGKTYEWFVGVESGTNRTVSPAWTFTTSAASPDITGQPTALEVLRVKVDEQGRFVICWRSTGGARYRIEYSDGNAGGGFTGVFSELVRPASQELDGASAGMSSLQVFTDDFSLAGIPPHGARYYRIKRVL